MYFMDYDLRGFQKDFNKKIRNPDVGVKTKFKAVKLSLIVHLDKFGKTLQDLKLLEIAERGFNLEFSYIEETGTRTYFKLDWKTIEFDELLFQDEMKRFSRKVFRDLKFVPQFPTLEFTSETMNNAYGQFYPDQNKILMSSNFVEHKGNKLAIKVLKHEILHFVCYTIGKPAQDTDEYFIRLLIKFDAYISLEPLAQQAYLSVLEKIKLEEDVQQSIDIRQKVGKALTVGMMDKLESEILGTTIKNKY